MLPQSFGQWQKRICRALLSPLLWCSEHCQHVLMCRLNPGSHSIIDSLEAILHHLTFGWQNTCPCCCCCCAWLPWWHQWPLTHIPSKLNDPTLHPNQLIPRSTVGVPVFLSTNTPPFARRSAGATCTKHTHTHICCGTYTHTHTYVVAHTHTRARARKQTVCLVPQAQHTQ
jgi:hypothetical protein